VNFYFRNFYCKGKRVYGVPSIRNDLIAPRIKKMTDRKNYGDDGTCFAVVQPSIFSKHGVYEKDVLQARSKEEIRSIFANIGVDLPDDLFNNVWENAKAALPSGDVSVETFRNVLDQALSSSSLI
jgi:hypothetical protein